MQRKEGVVNLLKDAAKLITEYSLLIYDAWRQTRLQAELYVEQEKKIKQEQPEISENELSGQSRKYVSLPSDKPGSPSPHLTGGAIDLTICDSAGTPLFIGTNFDYFGIEAKTRFYEEKIEHGEQLTESETMILCNRRLLFHLTSRVGFTNYREEWWHYDYGNQFWGKVKGCASICGQSAPVLNNNHYGK